MTKRIRIARQFLFLVFGTFLLSSCGLKSSDPATLYRDLLNTSPYEKVSGFKGDGRFAIPNFMTWAIFSYTADSDFVKYLKSYNSFEVSSTWNKTFEQESIKDFPKDLTYWTQNSKVNVSTDFDFTKCAYYRGVNFPFIHEVLIDTTNFHVLHLVSGMRD